MIKWVQLCIVSLKVTKLPWHWGLTEPLFIVSHRKATGLWIWDVWEPYTITSEKIQNILIYGCKTNLIKTLFKKKKEHPMTRMPPLQRNLQGFWRGILPQPAEGFGSPFLSPRPGWLPWRWGGGACESQVWARDHPPSEAKAITHPARRGCQWPLFI